MLSGAVDARKEQGSVWDTVCRAPVRFVLRAWPVVVCLLVLLHAPTARAAGLLEMIREDIRTAPARSSGRDYGDRDHDYDDDDDSFLGSFLGELFGTILSGHRVEYHEYHYYHEPAPAEPEVEFYFPRFPYDEVPGYMVPADWPGGSVLEGRLCQQTYCPEPDYLGLDRSLLRFRRWSARLRAEYADNFGDLSRVGGHLLLSTTSGWGIDTEMDYLEESLARGAHDQLWLGDLNVVYRFRETEHSQWRTGLGLNWLDDPADTNFGFNFTLGTDYFPRRPWVISSTLDWGTLGRAEQFRFRVTAGVMVRRIEAYTGWEYYDLDRTQINSLIGGVRVWF